MTNDRLPPLPEPLKQVAVAGYHDGALKDALEDYYDADQIRAYAILALEAQASAPGGEVAEEMVDSVRADIMQAAANAGHPEIVLQDEWVRAALAEALAARAPSESSIPVAKVIRKGNHTGTLTWTDHGLLSSLPDETYLYTSAPAAGDGFARSDVHDLVDWIFTRFGAPVDAGELPQHIIAAVRRLEAALAHQEPAR